MEIDKYFPTNIKIIYNYYMTYIYFLGTAQHIKQTESLVKI